MEIKHIYTEIRQLKRLEQINFISEWGLEKLKEYTYLADLHKENVKNATIPVVKSFYCNNDVIGLKTQCKEQCKECSKWIKTAFNK